MSSGFSSDSGLAIRTVSRRTSSLGEPEPVEVGGPDERPVLHLDQPARRPARSRPGGAASATGSARGRTARTAARRAPRCSRRSGRPPRRGRTGSVTSGRQVGGSAVSVVAVGGDRAADRAQVRRRVGVGVDRHAGDPRGQVDRGGDRLAARAACRRTSRRRSRCRRRARRAAARPGPRRTPGAAGRRRARSAWTPRRAACAGARCGRSWSARSARPRSPPSVVVSDSSVVWPPITPAMPIGPLSSVISRSSADRLRRTSSRVVIFSPSRGPSYDDRAGELVAVVAVHRLAELEHHVVGDVDAQRDRPHPGELDPPGDVPRASARPGRSR